MKKRAPARDLSQGNERGKRAPARDLSRKTRGAKHAPASTLTTRRERERLRHRLEILEAAEELFARFGYEKTGVKLIADRAELSVGQIYNHFEGKEEIFRELMERRMNELHERGDEASRPDDPPLRRLRCRIEAAVEHFRRHRDFMIIYHNENPLALHGMVMEEIQRNRGIIAGLLAEALARGDIPDENPHELATLLIGAVHGLIDMLAECENEGAFDGVPALLDRIVLRPLERRGRRSQSMEDDE